MRPKIITLDGKNRITIPKDCENYFTKGIVYYSMRVHGILLGNSPFTGVGVGQESLDSIGRIYLGKDLIVLSGATEKDINTKEVLWIPVRNRDILEYLLLFGESGKKHLRTILKRKDAISPLIIDGKL